jgi:hypothetical protein
VHKLSYTVKGQRHEVQVGKPVGTVHEIAFAILETSRGYVVCTPQRGIGGQAPVLVKRRDVVDVGDFDPIESQQPA